MLKLRQGSKIPYPDELNEGYMICENQIIANVSADNIEKLMTHFINMRKEPVFFFLELPAKQEDEQEVIEGNAGTLHKDVYYIDGCSDKEAADILNRVGRLMVNDGLCSFGFGGHDTHDEIMFGKYNVTTIYSQNLSRFDGFFEEHGINKCTKLITAWDTFSREHYGVSERVLTDGKDIYSIPDILAELGIYKAEQRME